MNSQAMNSTLQRAASAISALVIGSVFFIASFQLKVDQTYSDFVVGSLAWYAGNKFQDLAAWPIFILFSFLGFSALSKISRSLHENHGPEASTGFAAQLILWSIPFYAGVATLFLGGAIDKKTAAISALGVISLGVIGFLKRRGPHKPDPGLWGATLLIALLISLIPIEAAVLLSRAPADTIGQLVAKPFVRASDALALFGFASAIFALSRRANSIGRHLSKLTFVAQIGLPLFFLTLYPSKILQPSGEVIAYETTFYLKILIASLIAYGMYDVIKRSRSAPDDSDWRRLFSPFALFAFIVALKTGHTTAPGVGFDDYHFGEHLLGWWSYLRGLVPYVDYVPPHGLIENDFASMLSSVFYDGTAASTGEAGRLAIALLALATFISVYSFTGSLVLAFSVTLSLGGRLTWFFFTPFICLWLSAPLRAKPGKWLSIWILSAPLVILGVPPQGLLLVAAFGFLAAKMAWDQIKFGDKKSWRHLGLVTASTLLIYAVTPGLSMLIGAIRYVLENGPINQIAYGIPWSLSSNAGAQSGFVFEAIRMSWIVIPMLAAYAMHKHWRNFMDSASSFYPGLVFFSFCLLLIPYSMGRIDPGATSRPGLVSIFGWAILFPLLVWGLSKAKDRAFVVLSTVCMSALIGFGITPFSSLSTIAAQSISSLPLRDSAAAGLPNIGRAFMEESQWDRINRLNKILLSRLSKDETYLDLTSHNAHYFYLNRTPAMPVTAPYNLASSSQQRRAVDALKASPPKIALLQAENIIQDGGGLALRNPLLYRFAMDHYTPRMESGFIVGYLKSGAKKTTDTVITAEIKDFTDVNWIHGVSRGEGAIVLSDPVLAQMLKVGDYVRFADGQSRAIERVWVEGTAIWFSGGKVPSPDTSTGNFVDVVVSPGVYQEYVASLFQRSFAVSDFQKIPVSWGRSQKSLLGRMTSPVNFGGLTATTAHGLQPDGSFKVEGSDPQLAFDISKLDVSGHRSGLLKLDFNCIEQTSEPRMQIFWWGDERTNPFEASSIRFTAENGTLIVPLDASPWWTGLRRVKGIRFDLDNPQACRAFIVKNISLYQRK